MLWSFCQNRMQTVIEAHIENFLLRLPSKARGLPEQRLHMLR